MAEDLFYPVNLLLTSIANKINSKRASLRFEDSSIFIKQSFGDGADF